MKKLKILFVSLLLITGCLGGYSPESKFYSLQSTSNVDPVSQKKISIGIDDIILPDIADRPQIVVSKKDSPEVIISETNRWSESLDTMIQRVLGADISAYLPQATVKNKELNETFTVVISVEIVQFKMTEDQSATLEAWWYILDKFGTRTYRQKFVGETEIGRSFDSFVEAESKLLSSLAKEIAKKISE